MTVGAASPCPLYTSGRPTTLIDSFAPLAANVIRMACALGIKLFGRYVENLTAEERDNIFAQGGSILPLSEACVSVALTASLGAELGKQRASKLAALLCPPKVHLWTDHESPAAGSDSLGYLRACASETLAGSFGAALYLGAPNDLTGAQAFSMAFDRYGKGGGRVPEPTCGFTWLQLEPIDQIVADLGGQRVDYGVIKEDYEGRVPIIWCPS